MRERSGSPASPAPLSTVAALLTVAGVMVLFLVPGSLLVLCGISYNTPTGAAWEKVHPGTGLIVLAILAASLRSGNPLRYMQAQFRRYPGVAILFAATVLLMIYLIKVQQAPFTAEIDTFIMPVMLFLLLVDLPPRARAAIEIGLHVILAANAAVGIVEYLSGWRLIPMRMNGFDVTAEVEWRAFGFFGHPLSSAATNGLYAVMVAMGYGRLLPGWLRLPVVAFQLVSLGAFGGRTALVLTLVCLIGLATLRAAGILAGRRFDRRALVAALLLAPLLAAGAVLLVTSGFFDQLLLRFVEDNGSAKSRAIIFHLFSYFSWHELLFGPDQDHLSTVLHLEGIEVGIESFWIGLVMLCGLWMATLFFAAFGLFMGHVMQNADRGAIVALLYYGLIISTTLSLNAKTASLGQFITMVMILMPPTAQRAPRTVSGRTPVLARA